MYSESLGDKCNKFLSTLRNGTVSVVSKLAVITSSSSFMTPAAEDYKILMIGIIREQKRDCYTSHRDASRVKNERNVGTSSRLEMGG